MEDWWSLHGGKHDDPEWRKLQEIHQRLLVPKINEMMSEHVNENSDGHPCFGMSKAHGCTRSYGLRQLGYKAEPTTGSTQFTFFLGHHVEIMALATLEAMGYDFGSEDAQVRARVDPMLDSAMDGVGTFEGKQTILSVKSTGYKKSGKVRGGKWERRGFPELPFRGVRRTQPGWWAQVQAEMRGSGIRQAMVVAVAKDIVKAMEDDPYLGRGGNGSLTFYCELIQYDEEFVEKHLLPVMGETWNNTIQGKAGRPWFLSATSNRYQLLNQADKDNWQPNAGLSGTYNPCAYCDYVQACKEAP